MKNRQKLVCGFLTFVFALAFMGCFWEEDVLKELTGNYEVGDTGPAGGLIFYDKGDNSGGWRYLEAAPVETEFLAKWSIVNTKVENTQEIIGIGKRNTQLIVEAFNEATGEWDTAAQKCDELEFGGFNDWFLPSKDELDQMYGNLKRKKLGNFKNDLYWSSTQVNSNFAHFQDFSDGRINSAFCTNSYYVRPVRQVSALD